MRPSGCGNKADAPKKQRQSTALNPHVRHPIFPLGNTPMFQVQPRSETMMKTHSIAPLAALGLLLGAASGAAQAAPQACQSVTEEQVAAQFDRFNAAWATGNPDTVAALFAPDATLLATVSNAERSTPEKIRAYFVDFLKGEPVGRIDSSTIVIDCNTASRTGNWTVNMKNANGERVDVPARYSFLYRWDGSDWKIKHLHSSVRPPVNP
jgi:uncharacterized protein (TIGR02246 family)